VDTVQDKEAAEVGTIAVGGIEEGNHLGQEGNHLGQEGNPVEDSQTEGILKQADIQQVGNQQGDILAADIEAEDKLEVPRDRLLAR
jgi:hypothetical protein